MNLGALHHYYIITVIDSIIYSYIQYICSNIHHLDIMTIQCSTYTTDCHHYNTITSSLPNIILKLLHHHYIIHTYTIECTQYRDACGLLCGWSVPRGLEPSKVTPAPPAVGQLPQEEDGLPGHRVDGVGEDPGCSIRPTHCLVPLAAH